MRAIEAGASFPALRLAGIERHRHADRALNKSELAEYLALPAQLRGLHLNDLDDLKRLAAPIQQMPNKFPGETMPSDGKIIPHKIIDGNKAVFRLVHVGAGLNCIVLRLPPPESLRIAAMVIVQRFPCNDSGEGNRKTTQLSPAPTPKQPLCSD